MTHLRTRPRPGRPEPRHTAEAIAAQQPDGLPPSPPELTGDPFTDTALIRAFPLIPEHTMPIPALVAGPEDCQMPCDADCEIGPVHCWNWHRPNHKPDWHDPAKCDAPPAMAAPRRALAVFRADLAELPAFRQTVRACGWNGLHLRAAVRGRW
jgi:hypothetical protein